MLHYCFCFMFWFSVCKAHVGRWSLHHWTTREVPQISFLFTFSPLSISVTCWNLNTAGTAGTPSKHAQPLSHVQLFATPQTVACQAPPSVGLSQQEYWSGLPFPPPGDFPHSEIQPTYRALQADSFLWATGETPSPSKKTLNLEIYPLPIYSVNIHLVSTVCQAWAVKRNWKYGSKQHKPRPLLSFSWIFPEDFKLNTSKTKIIPFYLLQSVPYFVFYFLVNINNSIQLRYSNQKSESNLDSYLIDIFLTTIKSTFQYVTKSSSSFSSTDTLHDYLGSVCIKWDSFMPTSWGWQ